MALPQQKIPTKLPSELSAFERIVEQRFLDIQRTLSLLFVGKGTPYNTVDAPKGAVFLRTDGSTGTSFYVNETGGRTGWVAK